MITSGKVLVDRELRCVGCRLDIISVKGKAMWTVIAGHSSICDDCRKRRKQRPRRPKVQNEDQVQ